jgi:hypothetical protein
LGISLKKKGEKSITHAIPISLDIKVYWKNQTNKEHPIILSWYQVNHQITFIKAIQNWNYLTQGQ